MNPMDPNLINLCQMLLVPASILFAAIGIAQSVGLKALVSVIGTVLGGLWFCRFHTWWFLEPEDRITVLGLALIFGLAAFLSTVVHAKNWWNKKLTT
jgi:hypothetical protein